MPTALTVAGSDSSGGAGIQADLRTFRLFGVHGFSVITALTAQHSRGILGISAVTPEFVALQLDAVVMDMRPDAMKTGMLATAETVSVAAAFVARHGIDRLVVDPVFMSTSGTPLVEPGAVATVLQKLMPLTALITPNLAEAETLTGLAVRDLASMEEAARRLCALGARAALVKGGHLEGDAVDVLFDGTSVTRFPAPRLAAANSHGTGCVLSAAITARLAYGDPLTEAVRVGKQTVSDALRRGMG